MPVSEPRQASARLLGGLDRKILGRFPAQSIPAFTQSAGKVARGVEYGQGGHRVHANLMDDR
jgi:hypothetical protein